MPEVPSITVSMRASRKHRSTPASSASPMAPIASIAASLPARADAKRQALVDHCLKSAQKVLSGKDYPDALKFMPKARGVMIVPELVQGGFVFLLAWLLRGPEPG